MPGATALGVHLHSGPQAAAASAASCFGPIRRWDIGVRKDGTRNCATMAEMGMAFGVAIADARPTIGIAKPATGVTSRGTQWRRRYLQWRNSTHKRDQSPNRAKDLGSLFRWYPKQTRHTKNRSKRWVGCRACCSKPWRSKNLAVPQLSNFTEIVRKKLDDLKGEPTREELEQELRVLSDKKTAKFVKLKKNEKEVSELQSRLDALVVATKEVQTEVTIMEKRMKELVEKLHAESCEEAVQMDVTMGAQEAHIQEASQISQKRAASRDVQDIQVPDKASGKPQPKMGAKRECTEERGRSKRAEGKVSAL